MWKVRVAGAMAASALVAVTATSACGRSSDSRGRSGDGSGGSSGVGGVVTGGAAASPAGGSAQGGSGATNPTGGAAGEPSAGGEGGAATCVEGAPCDCEPGTGTIRCTEDGPTCACPPDDCGSEPVDCFEPCGGNPFGNWVLEDACFPGGELGDCAGSSLSATFRALNLRVRFTESGAVVARGDEEWDLTLTASPSCVGAGGVESCSTGVAWASPLLFGSNRWLLAGCEENACGSCTCSGSPSGGGGDGSWSEMGVVIGNTTVPYCVDGDVLWLGGYGEAGEPRTAYKFRKQSCIRTTTACEERTPAECESTGECMMGRCVATGGDATKCNGVYVDSLCEVPDCTWVTDTCSPSGIPSCPFDTCELSPHCTLGPPAARCTGSAWCGGTDATECNEPGCYLRRCLVGNAGEPVCANLFTDQCALVEGCSVVGDRCEGTARCAAQPNDEACVVAGCVVRTQCWGAPFRSCEELSVEECHDLPGCGIEW